MTTDTIFQRTMLHSMMYKRREKIDEIVYMSDVLQNDFFGFATKVIEVFKTISLEDKYLDRRIELTENNNKLILDGINKNFSEAAILKAQHISELITNIKENFDQYKEDREKRVSSLKKYAINTSENNNGVRKSEFIQVLYRELKCDESELISRQSAFINFEYDIEIPIAEITLEEWNNQLTDPKKYKRGNNFKFLVHAINTGLTTALSLAKTSVFISTSLITNEFQGTYGNSKFGFVYRPNKKNVLLIGDSDLVSISSTISIENIHSKNFGLTSIMLTPNSYLLYNDEYACKTRHIEEIEEKSKKNQITEKKSDSYYNYNEILLLNNFETNPIAVFLIEADCRVDDRNSANKLADRLELPLILI